MSETGAMSGGTTISPLTSILPISGATGSGSAPQELFLLFEDGRFIMLEEGTGVLKTEESP
jgi:hypothetical protein